MAQISTGGGRTVRGAVTSGALAVVLCVAVVAFTVPGGAIQTAQTGPTIENATTTQSSGNLTITITATNVTEIDVTAVPDGWSVVAHDDDFGAYIDQLENESRVVWLWRVPGSATVSVTFAVPDPDPSTHEVHVVPYDGTDRGPAVSVSGGTETPASSVTPTATTPTETVADVGSQTPERTTETGTDPLTDDPVADATDRAISTATAADGPGFGPLAAAVATALALAVSAIRCRTR